MTDCAVRGVEWTFGAEYEIKTCIAVPVGSVDRTCMEKRVKRFAACAEATMAAKLRLRLGASIFVIPDREQ